MASDDEVSQERLSYCRDLVKESILQMENSKLKAEGKLLNKLLANDEDKKSQETKPSKNAASSEHQEPEKTELMQQETFNLEMFKQKFFDAESKKAEHAELSKACAELMQEEILVKRKSEKKSQKEKDSEKVASSQPKSSYKSIKAMYDEMASKNYKNQVLKQLFKNQLDCIAEQHLQEQSEKSASSQAASSDH